MCNEASPLKTGRQSVAQEGSWDRSVLPRTDLGIMVDVNFGLCWMKQQNYVHRDLKLGNILVNKEADAERGILHYRGVLVLGLSSIFRYCKQSSTAFSSLTQHEANQSRALSSHRIGRFPSRPEVCHKQSEHECVRGVVKVGV